MYIIINRSTVNFVENRKRMKMYGHIISICLSRLRREKPKVLPPCDGPLHSPVNNSFPKHSNSFQIIVQSWYIHDTSSCSKWSPPHCAKLLIFSRVLFVFRLDLPQDLDVLHFEGLMMAKGRDEIVILLSEIVIFEQLKRNHTESVCPCPCWPSSLLVRRSCPKGDRNQDSWKRRSLV